MDGKKLTFDEFKDELISKIESQSVPALVDYDAPEAKSVFLHEILENYFEELNEVSDEAPEYFSDNRIEAMLYSKDKEALYLFISDYSGRNLEFTKKYLSKESLIERFKLTKNTLKQAISGLYATNLELSDPLYDFLKSVCENRDLIKSISLYLITDGLTNLTELDKEIYSRYTIEYNVRNLEYLYKDYTLPFEEPSLEINLEKFGITPVCFSVPFDSPEVEYTSYIAVIPGILLAKLYKEYQGEILQGNIRVFLQAKRPINRGIKAALEGRLGNKARFFAYNNGISATAEAVTLSHDSDGKGHLKTIKNFQIVNGGQTTASIHNVWTAHNYDDSCLDGIYVLMKLTVVSDKELLRVLVPKIAEYSNTQNAIAKPDFASNDSFYADLEKWSRNTCIPGTQTKWFYERTSGQYGETKRLSSTSKSGIKEFEAVYPRNRLISKTDIGLYFMAWAQFPYTASTGGSKNFNEYNKRLKALGEGFLPSADCNYYKEMVGLAIIFNSLKKCVKSLFADLHIVGGAKQQVVIYAMSLFSYLTQQKLNLIKIWDVQGSTDLSLPDDLEKYLKELCNRVYRYFVNWNQAGKILTEWTKSESCWTFLRDERTEYHITFPTELSNYLLSDADVKKRDEWLHSLYSETTHEKSEKPVVTDTVEPKNEQTSNDEKPSAKVSSVKFPEDLAGFLTKSSGMEISKFISQLQFDKAVDDKVIEILQHILAMRRARKRIPDKMMRDVVKLFASIDEESESPDNKRSDEPKDKQDDKMISDCPVFEYHSKGAFGKMIFGDNNTYVLLKGSTITLDDAPSFRDGLKKLRDEMLQNSEIIRNPDGLTATLMKDMVMDSSGAAAAFVSANNPSGPTSWKYGGKTLKEYLEQNK